MHFNINFFDVTFVIYHIHLYFLNLICMKYIDVNKFLQINIIHALNKSCLSPWVSCEAWITLASTSVVYGALWKLLVIWCFGLSRLNDNIDFNYLNWLVEWIIVPLVFYLFTLTILLKVSCLVLLYNGGSFSLNFMLN